MEREITLRKLMPENADYAKWFWFKDVVRFIKTKKLQREDAMEYIAEKNLAANTYLFGIFEDNKHIGNVKLENGELGILIGDQRYWGKGICTEVCKRMRIFARQVLGLKRIKVVVSKNHKAAIRCYEKAGMKKGVG